MGKKVFCILWMSFCCCVAAKAQTKTAAGEGNYKIKTIVIDAGHGGYDSGCRGKFSNEKDVTLEIALKAGEEIKKNFPGIRIVYTRTTDTFIELYQRAEIANLNHADLFISFHCNANRNKDAFGTETWSMGLHKSDDNLEVSKRENDVILLEDNYKQNYDGFDPNSPEGYIILSMNQNAHLDQSIDLASKVQDQFKSEGRLNRGVKQAGFLVLWRTTMPSILIETGFLTNLSEEKYLNSSSGQYAIAHAVMNAVGNYKNEVEDLNEDEAFHENGNAADVASADPDSPAENAELDETISAEPSTHHPEAIHSENNTVVKSSSDVTFRIQLHASKTALNIGKTNLAKVKDLTMEKSDGWYRYYAGKYNSATDSRKRLSSLKKQGYKDAYIVEFKNGKRIGVYKGV